MNAANSLEPIIFNPKLGKRALIGATIAVSFILLFIATSLIAKEGELAFGLWVLLPMFTVSVGGACGGIFYHIMDILRLRGTWQKIVANIISFFVYIIGCWMSLIIALAYLGFWD